jgi:hypothetical protein
VYQYNMEMTGAMECGFSAFCPLLRALATYFVFILEQTQQAGFKFPKVNTSEKLPTKMGWAGKSYGRCPHNYNEPTVKYAYLGFVRVFFLSGGS